MNKEILKDAIACSGMTMTSIAEKMGISRESLYNKANGSSEFSVSEINRFCEALHLDNDSRDAIFFSKKSE